MNDTQQMAFSNLTNAIDVKLRFPDKVFSSGWGHFRFFDSDRIFDPSFIDIINQVLNLEGGSCVCMLNIDAYRDSLPDERAMLFIDLQTSGEIYMSRLRGPTVAEGWIYDMNRFAFASDAGQWSLYCEKGNEIAVISFRETNLHRNLKEASRQTTLQPVRNPGSTPITFFSPSGAESSSWRRFSAKTRIASVSAFSFEKLRNSVSMPG